MQTPKFSVLLPIYRGDNAAFFMQAWESITTAQQLKPSEIVLVQDGPVSSELTAAVNAAIAATKIPVQHIVLPSNQGLYAALNAGLAACSHEIVARMDADDVCDPARFSTQLAVFAAENLDLLGSAMYEFENDPGVPSGLRLPPESATEIRAHAKTHNPFNHPTVVYRKSLVAQVGGYQEFGNMEDYWLMVRLLLAGAKAKNLAAPLLAYRVGAGAYKRRGGIRTAATELRLQRAMLRVGFISKTEFVRNCVLKTGYRLLPAGIKKVLFRKFFAKGLPRAIAS